MDTLSIVLFDGFQEIYFLAGETEKLITVQILDDEHPEPDESFQIILASPQNGLTVGTPSYGG